MSDFLNPAVQHHATVLAVFSLLIVLLWLMFECECGDQMLYFVFTVSVSFTNERYMHLMGCCFGTDPSFIWRMRLMWKISLYPKHNENCCTFQAFLNCSSIILCVCLSSVSQLFVFLNVPAVLVLYMLMNSQHAFESSKREWTQQRSKLW